MIEQNYKTKIAYILNCSAEKVFLYWKGRVALYAILKAMNIEEGDEVILPAFTCVVVPNAILYLKAKPVYVDITTEDYNIDVEQLEKSITDKTKVIICQNTFGLSSNLEKILEISRQYNLTTVEDCTHGFGGFYNGRPNGSYCDAAFYSTQWNKPFSTGIGGFLIVNNDELTDKIKALEEEKVPPRFQERLYLSSLLILNRFLINSFTYWSLLKFYRYLSKKNLVIGSNRGEELSETKMPENYFKDISSVQIRAGVKELDKLETINKIRKKNARDYTRFLKSKYKTYVNENLFANHLFLKYPVMVKDRNLFLRLAEEDKISLGDWFLSPLHPVMENLEKWEMKKELYPVANRISERILNLPTDVQDNTRVIKFLLKHLELLD